MRKTFLFVGLTMGVLAIVARAQVRSFCDTDPAGGYKMTWHDEFDGPELNTDNWNVATDTAGWHFAYGRDALCTKDNVYIENGNLVLRSQRQVVDKWNYTTGGVDTMNKAWWTPSPTYRMCIRAILPGGSTTPGGGQGIWPAHWMMPQDKACDPDEGEMDIMEMVNGNGRYEATYHWQNNWPAEKCKFPQNHGAFTTNFSIPDFGTAFHEYAMERGKDYLAFVVDGKTMTNVTRSDAKKPLFWDMPFYLILNSAVGGKWPGPATEQTVFPTHHLIDYVRVSQKV